MPRKTKPRTAAEREQQAAAQRARYASDLERYRRIIREKSQRVRAARSPVIDAIKMEHGCVDCGYDAHPAALHFDHVDPSTKLFGIAKGLTRSWSAILAEIAKCEVRCANCHAIRGVQEGHLGRPRLSVASPPIHEQRALL